MDFKVAGTREFVTALQLDTKLDGIPAEVLAAALTQARDARLAILDVMAEAIDAPEEMSSTRRGSSRSRSRSTRSARSSAPRARSSTRSRTTPARRCRSRTTARSTSVRPTARRPRLPSHAVNAIANPTMPEVGERYLGTVVKTTNFGAFVSLHARQGRPAAHQQAAFARRRQARRGRRGRRLGGPEDPGPDRRDRRPRQAVAGPGRRGRAAAAAAEASTPDDSASPTSTGRRTAAGRSSVSGPGTLETVRDAGGQVTSRVRRTVLPGGLRVITEQMAGVRSASVGVWVGVGSRDETPTLHGCSHFLEHLLFKGTGERSAMDISIALDAVGGEFNAFTAKEYTCFHARVLDDDLPLAVDVLGDMVTDSLLSAEDVEAERDVILDEIAMHDDDPDDVVHNLFAAAGVGRRPAGPPDRRHRRRRSPRSPATRSRASTAATTGPRTWWSPSPATSTTPPSSPGPHGFGRNGFLAGERAAVRAAAPPPAPPRSTPGTARGEAAVRAGQPGARRQRASPATTTAASRSASSTPRSAAAPRQPAVPGGARAPRARLQRLQLRLPPRRRRPGRRLRRLPARAGSTTSSASVRDELAGSRPRASPPRSSSAARASCAAGWCSASRTPASRMSRLGKAELVYDELLSHRRGDRPHRRRHPGRTRRRTRCSPSPRSSPSSAVR